MFNLLSATNRFVDLTMQRCGGPKPDSYFIHLLTGLAIKSVCKRKYFYYIALKIKSLNMQNDIDQKTKIRYRRKNAFGKHTRFCFTYF
jgi:hypothetical protein